MTATPALVAGQGLVKTFRTRGGSVRAVDGVDLAVHAGEALGIVGESACGKTTLGRLLVGLYRPDAGQVLWQGRELSSLSAAQRQAASRDVQMVFQDPMRRSTRATLSAASSTHRWAGTAPATALRARRGCASCWPA